MINTQHDGQAGEPTKAMDLFLKFQKETNIAGMSTSARGLNRDVDEKKNADEHEEFQSEMRKCQECSSGQYSGLSTMIMNCLAA